MHVLLIADHAEAEGGAPQVAIASARALAEAGVNVTYLHGVGATGAAALDHPMIRRIGLGGRDIHDKPPLAALADGIWNREARTGLARALAEAPAGAILHVHQWTKYFSASLFAALRASGRPLVLSLHDYFVACPNRVKYRLDTGEPCRLTPLSAGCLFAGCDPKSRLHKAIRVARTVAARRAIGEAPVLALHVSETSRRVIGPDLPAHWRQEVLENPIEVDPAPAPRPHPGDAITYCGRLTEEKGVRLVARAARAMGRKALFLGEGPLHKAILAENPDAEITGWLPREAVRARLHAEARVLVAPSLWPETGPMVVAEAQSLGVPVIASDRAGAAGRVRHGVDGFVVAPEEAALTAALGRLESEAEARTMGEAAWHAFRDASPTPARHAERLIALYRSL